MEELVQKARKGNREAFLQLVESQLDKLYRIAYSQTGCKEMASDAIQDSLLTAFSKIKLLKDPGKFDSWLTAILVNRCRELLRKSRREQWEEFSDEKVDKCKIAPNPFALADEKSDLLNALSKLGEIYRDVISLKYMGDRSISEISTILEIPEGTVKSRLNYGLRQLRGIMEVKSNGMQ